MPSKARDIAQVDILIKETLARTFFNSNFASFLKLRLSSEIESELPNNALELLLRSVPQKLGPWSSFEVSALPRLNPLLNPRTSSSAMPIPEGSTPVPRGCGVPRPGDKNVS